jgi:hypothetical protein
MTGKLKEQREDLLVRTHGKVQEAENKTIHTDRLRAGMRRAEAIILHVQRHPSIFLFNLQNIAQLKAQEKVTFTGRYFDLTCRQGRFDDCKRAIHDACQFRI